MKTARTIESLVFVALVTSAAVMEIREHLLPAAPAAVMTHDAATPCALPRPGVVPAACSTLRDEADPAAGVAPDNDMHAMPHGLRGHAAGRAAPALHRAQQVWV